MFWNGTLRVRMGLIWIAEEMASNPAVLRYDQSNKSILLEMGDTKYAETNGSLQNEEMKVVSSSW
jgi:hypothetical protein